MSALRIVAVLVVGLVAASCADHRRTSVASTPAAATTSFGFVSDDGGGLLRFASPTLAGAATYAWIDLDADGRRERVRWTSWPATATTRGGAIELALRRPDGRPCTVWVLHPSTRGAVRLLSWTVVGTDGVPFDGELWSDTSAEMLVRAASSRASFYASTRLRTPAVDAVTNPFVPRCSPAPPASTSCSREDHCRPS